jgi:hypothetical protein
MSFHERTPDGALEAADVLADGGLAQMEMARGVLETAVVRNSHETAQGRDVQ